MIISAFTYLKTCRLTSIRFLHFLMIFFNGWKQCSSSGLCNVRVVVQLIKTVLISLYYPQINYIFFLKVKNDSNDNVRVVVRCRPLNEKEKGMNCKVAVKCDEVRGTVSITTEGKGGDPPKVFTFDRVFGPESKQTDVYNDAARPIVESVIEGYNGMFAKCLVFSCFDCFSETGPQYLSILELK